MIKKLWQWADGICAVLYLGGCLSYLWEHRLNEAFLAGVGAMLFARCQLHEVHDRLMAEAQP